MNATFPTRFLPCVETLEDRQLLDGGVSLGTLGGPGYTDPLARQRLEISVIVIGSAITAALLYNPPGCPGGGGSAPGGQGYQPPPPWTAGQVLPVEADALVDVDFLLDQVVRSIEKP